MLRVHAVQRTHKTERL
ncbi:hypothetical protein E2C01_069929 [Portunus trituberculatus]|uniref:Uncharacterized protein n=1 Tax=Portunus trituberculatus TaxID=210409 RepID=A0A5B7I0U9_PORTR|nr:hypothetical protein [Portunus trituberculatus]